MRMLGAFPETPRPLRAFDQDRVKKLLALAQILLDTQATESTEKSVEYLLRICQTNPPLKPVPQLPWLSVRTPSDFDRLVDLDPTHLAPIQRLMPQMRFSANLGRRRA